MQHRKSSNPAILKGDGLFPYRAGGTEGRFVRRRARHGGGRGQVVLHHQLCRAVKLIVRIEQGGREVLAEEPAHVLVLVGGPPALQEADVAAARRNQDGNVGRTGRRLDRDRIERLERELSSQRVSPCFLKLPHTPRPKSLKIWGLIVCVVGCNSFL